MLPYKSLSSHASINKKRKEKKRKRKIEIKKKKRNIDNDLAVLPSYDILSQGPSYV